MGPLVAELVDSRLAAMGRKRSRVKSRISEPMAPIAAPYRSLRILDSPTKNSANSRTRSASLAAADSLWAKAVKRSMVSWVNSSVVWLMTACREGDSGAGVSISLPIPLCEPDDDRLPVGGVGRALGASGWFISGCFELRGDKRVGVSWPERT